MPLPVPDAPDENALCLGFNPHMAGIHHDNGANMLFPGGNVQHHGRESYFRLRIPGAP